MDSIDLAMLARGELVASGRTFYGIGGIYGSLLLDAQRSHEGRITDMDDTISAVDAGWILGAGFELSSIAAVKPAIELRYQRGFRNLLPASPGEVNQQTLSCLVSITYGGASLTGPPEPTPGALYSGDGDRTTKAPSTKRATSVVMGNPGDRWLDTMRFTRIARATRGGRHGYEVSYDIAGHGPAVLFWPRERIDFDGRSPGSRLKAMKLRKGRLWYPWRITRRTLPEVHQGILQIEAAYAKQADGANSAMEGFAIVASLGGLQPTLRATAGPPPRSAARRGASRVPSPSPRAAAARGGAQPVRVGQAGEAAVRAVVDIGPQVPIRIAGRTRIPDGLTNTILSEVKNVQSLSYTQQLRDFASHAQQTGRQFHLYVRPDTQLSGPLREAIQAGLIQLRFIP